MQDIFKCSETGICFLGVDGKLFIEYNDEYDGDWDDPVEFAWAKQLRHSLDDSPEELHALPHPVGVFTGFTWAEMDDEEIIYPLYSRVGVRVEDLELQYTPVKIKVENIKYKIT